MTILAGLVAAVLSQELDDAKIQALVTELRPDVEAVTGRRFSKMPSVRLSTRAEVEALLREELAPQMKVLMPEGTDEERDQAARSQSAMFARFFVAKYGWKENRIHVVPGNIEELARTLEQPALRGEPMLRVILAHELVHALDEEHFSAVSRIPASKTAAEIQIRGALIEGHAQFATRRFCEKRGEAEAFARYEAMILAPPPGLSEAERYMAQVASHHVKFAYIEGRAFFEGLARSGKPTFVQDAFTRPPATKDDLLQPALYYAPARPPAAAFDVAPALKAFADGIPDQRVRQDGDIDRSILRTVFATLVEEKPMEEALAGYVQGRSVSMAAPDGSRVSMMLVSRLRDAESARRFYDLSITLLKNKDEKMKEGQIRITEARYGRLEKLKDVEHTVATKNVALGGLDIEVRTFVGVLGEVALEITYSNETVSDDRIVEAVKAVRAALPPSKPRD
ncbi:MAG TPA: hypothetical protein VEJ18_22490 [Planctomycetota bacterium]|nr:hypothetical protein [Planctomycetota bacterium]